MRVNTMNSIDSRDGTGQSSDWTVSRIFFTTLNVVNHVLIAATTVYILYLALQKNNTYNNHAALFTVGYVLLMSEAITSLTGENIWSKYFSRRTNSYIHLVLQAAGAACSLAGFTIVYQVRQRHFGSIHAITGFTSIILLIVLMALSSVTLFAAKIRDYVRPVLNKFLHNFLGMACFVIGMVSQCYAYKKSWMVGKAGEDLAMACTVSTILIIVFSLTGALRSLFRQIISITKIINSQLFPKN